MLMVGFGEGDISPREGMDLPGGFYPNRSQGQLAPLKATACVLDDGKTRLALIGVDVLAVSRSTVEKARERIAQEAKVPDANVLINANHTHTGGPSVSVHETVADPAYEEILVAGIVSAAVQAAAAMHASELGMGLGREDSIAFNRRFVMSDGRQVTHPGKPGTEHHDEIVDVAGPTDSDVGVMAFREAGGTILGVIVNYACHSTIVGGNKYHPDYAGPLRDALKARFGGGCGVIFLLGACGDITQVNNLLAGAEFGLPYAELVGQKLAAEAARVITGLDWIDDADLAVTTETLSLDIRPEPDPAREKPPFGLGSQPDEVFAKGRARVAAIRAKTPTLPTEIQALRIGPLGISANSAEFFCELGLTIKAASPTDATWVVTLSNGVIWYVPTAQAFLTGGYESRTTTSSMWTIDAGQKMVEASLRGLTRLAIDV